MTKKIEKPAEFGDAQKAREEVLKIANENRKRLGMEPLKEGESDEKQAMVEPDPSSVVDNPLLKSVDSILNEKRQNKEMAIKDYFTWLVTWRRHRQELFDADYTIEAHSWDKSYEYVQGEDKTTRLYSDLRRENGTYISKDTLVALRQELYITLRIEGAKVQHLRKQLEVDFGVSDEDLEKTWNKWFQ
jgi:hypothetical protein